MLTLDRPDDATTSRGESAGSVCVRVRPDGPVVELLAGKTTVGSSPRCGIRIQQPGVQPLHCLILRTATEITARRWAGETTLNGDRLTDSPLQPGDCLQVGPVQLQVLDATGSTSETPGEFDPAALKPLGGTTALALPMLPLPRVDANRQSESNDKLREARDLARDRSRRMLNALRRSRQARAELSGQHEQLTAQKQQLERRIEALNERVEQLVAEQMALSSAHRSALDEKNALEAEARRAADEVWQVREQLQELTERCAAITSERDDAAIRCESLNAEYQAACEREANALASAARLETELNQLRQQYDELCMRLESSSGEQADVLREHEALRCEVQSFKECESSLRAELQQSHEENARLTSQLNELQQERGAVGETHDSLRAELAAEAENVSRLTREREELTAECDRLRAAADRLPDVERQLRSAIAEKENTASELYRSLLRLAQLEEESDHQAEIEAAHTAVTKELDRSRQEIASLQSQIDQLAADRTEIAEKKSSLEARIAQLIDAHQQVAHDRDELSKGVHALHEQLNAARQREEENLTRLEQAEALQQRLDDLEHSEAELVDTVERLKSELAESEKASAASAAEVESLESELEKSREAWQRERQQLSSDERNLKQRIEELEARLAKASAAKEMPATAPSPSLVPSPFSEVVHDDVPGASEIDTGSSVDDVPATDNPFALCSSHSTDVPSGYDWSAANGAIESADSHPLETSQPAAESVWGEPATEQHAWPVAGEQSLEQNSDTWNQTSSSFSPDEAAAGDQKEPSLDSATASFGTPSQEWGDEFSATPEVVDETPVAEPAPFQPASFIERYAHMFAEDAGGESTQPSPQVVTKQNDDDTFRKPSTLGLVQPEAAAKPASGKDEEESIEEYMAKLLQRVRGESASVSKPAANRDLGADDVPTSPSEQRFATGPLPAPFSASSVENESPVSLEAIRRKSPMVVPQTDLEALRALANESARRAISRHSARKLRRNATTKVIVATLAGVTSLWLMLNADELWDLQFITACVAMLVAAIWTGETFRTLLQTLRLATSEETDEEIEQLAAELRAPLPIDVEPAHSWVTTAPENGAGDSV